MPYITREYYNKFYGEPVSESDFPPLLERASEIVEELTAYRLNEESYYKMDGFKTERIKKAICAQIEYLNANGGSDMDNGESLQSATLGRFSYSSGSGMTGEGQSIYSPRAIRLLAPTGLLYRGGGEY